MPSKIKKRGKDSYMLSVSLGYDGNGQQQVETKTIKARTDREARKVYYQFEAEVFNGSASDDRKKISFSEFAELWYKDHCEPQLAPKTLMEYRRILDQRLLPWFNNKMLNSITGHDVQLLINALLVQGSRLDKRDVPITGHFAKKVYQVLSAMYNLAIKWDYADSNPCAKIDPPKIIKNERPIMEQEEMMLALNYSLQEGLYWGAVIHVALFCGLRIGEICGLKWCDINFDKRYLTVERTAQYIDGIGNVLKEPKSSAGNRIIALPDFLVELLLRFQEEQAIYRMQMGSQWHENNMTFPRWDGEILNTSTLYHWFQDFCAKYDLSKIPFHSLRHTAGTLALALGEDVNTVTKRMGHSDVSTTVNIYGHYLQAADRSLADKMDSFINNNGKL